MSGRFLLFPPFSSLTAIRFIDRILYPIARPFAGAMGTLFLLMNDNARSHRANILNLEAFWENGISFDVTRPQSYWTPQPYWTSQPYGTSQPYWTCLGFSKEAIQQWDPAPSNTNELEVVLLMEWDRSAQSMIRSLIRSFLRRCIDAIKTRMGHPKY